MPDVPVHEDKPDCVMSKPAKEVCTAPAEKCGAPDATPADCEVEGCPVKPEAACQAPGCPVKE